MGSSAGWVRPDARIPIDFERGLRKFFGRCAEVPVALLEGGSDVCDRSIVWREFDHSDQPFCQSNRFPCPPFVCKIDCKADMRHLVSSGPCESRGRNSRVECDPDTRPRNHAIGHEAFLQLNRRFAREGSARFNLKEHFQRGACRSLSRMKFEGAGRSPERAIVVNRLMQTTGYVSNDVVVTRGRIVRCGSFI